MAQKEQLSYAGFLAELLVSELVEAADEKNLARTIARYGRSIF